MRLVLPVVVGAQFAGTSLWFAGNAILPQLQAERGFEGGVGPVTSAVQLGFIVGTALLALTGVADRFQARTVFFASTLVGALANLGTIVASSMTVLIALRFVVGVALAGVYPIGMKAAAGHTQEGLGRALGFLVGALVLGTAFPHLVGSSLPWRWTLVAVSALAFVGGVAMLALVPDGPYTKTSSFDPKAVVRLLRIREFRGAALGYFGHMWELYTFWAFLPALLALHGDLPVSETSFLVIASGFVGCAGGGWLVPRFGSRAVAGVQLAISGACCALLPVAFDLPAAAFVTYLVVWGITVVGDSPQYSAINARSAPPELVGTGLSLVTSIGFALTVASVELADHAGDLRYALAALVIGPLLGLWGLTQAQARA
ncbi:MAG: MFS transporter [Myxococcota bacterium]